MTPRQGRAEGLFGANASDKIARSPVLEQGKEDARVLGLDCDQNPQRLRHLCHPQSGDESKGAVASSSFFVSPPLWLVRPFLSRTTQVRQPCLCSSRSSVLGHEPREPARLQEEGPHEERRHGTDALLPGASALWTELPNLAEGRSHLPRVCAALPRSKPGAAQAVPAALHESASGGRS